MGKVVVLPRRYAGKFIARINDRDVAVVREKGLDPRFVIVDYVPEEDVVFILFGAS
jgi:hypothetical protein